MGKLLRRIRQEGSFRARGYCTFDEFIRGAVPFSRRKVFYLMAVADTFDRLQVSPGRLGIPWSNARQLSSAISADHEGGSRDPIERQRLLSLAGRLPARALQNVLRGLRRLPPRNAVIFSCALTPEQRRVLGEALETARMQAGAERRELPASRLLELMCEEFLVGCVGIRPAVELPRRKEGGGQRQINCTPNNGQYIGANTTKEET